MSETVIEQVSLLMAKIEDNATTEAEREMLTRRVQTLVTRHQLDAALVRQQLEKSQRRETPVSKMITIGKAGQRALASWVELFMAIGRAQDIKFNIAQNSTFVIAFGFPSDIEVTETMYAGLLSHMVSEANAYLKSGEYRKEVQPLRVKKREPNPDYGQSYWGRDEPKYLYYWTTEMKPVSGLTARRNFYDSYTIEIRKRLREAKAEAVKHFQQEVDEQLAKLKPALLGEAQPTDGAMVLVKKREEVDEFYRSKSDARGSWRGGAQSGHYSSASASAGRSAGQRANIGGSAARGVGGGRRAIG